jgi:hypothetical protein
MATTVREIEHEIAKLREAAARDDVPELRTSVATHIAWVPPQWEDAAREVMEGLAERHPSRVIVLYPEPDAGDDDLEATPTLQCFPIPGSERELCAEVIDVHLRGQKVRVADSVVTPLLITDLPVFLRWRGDLPFGEPELEGLVELTDRLVVDSAEWGEAAQGYRELVPYFDRAVVSDIAWTRILQWRVALARRWPAIADVTELAVRGPRADALLLAGWLRARLGRDVELAHTEASVVESVEADREPVEIARYEPPTAADVLSDQLEIYSRDAVYEQAVEAAATT